MNETLTQIIIVIAIIILTAVTVRWQFPRTVTVIEYEQEEIDEGLWVRRSSYNTLANIRDSLKVENEVLADEVRRQGGQIANYTRIVGRLNVERDSLESVAKEYKLALDEEGELADTSYHFTETFGDSLFEVTSRVNITSGMLSNYLDLKQIRDIRINTVTTKDRRNDVVLTFVESPDFEELNFTTMHSLEQYRFTRRELFLIGVGSGIVIGGALFLIL